MTGELGPEPAPALDLDTRLLQTELYWGIGSAAFYDRCGVNDYKALAAQKTSLEEIDDGYQVSLDLKTNEITIKEIRMGKIIDPDATDWT